MVTRKFNKTAFVLQMPLSISAAEVVGMAKKKGIKLSEKYVWNIRAKAKANGGKTKRKPGRPPSKVNGSKLVVREGVSRDESVFANMALDMGLPRAEALLQRLRDAVATALQ